MTGPRSASYASPVVFQLTYDSVAVRPWSQRELQGLLEQARRHNLEVGVTGMLLYRDGRFFQLLEGSEHVVRRLYAGIVADPRHRDVTLARESRRVLRQFPSWTMAFRDLDEDPLSAPGFADVLAQGGGRTSAAVDELVARLRGLDPTHGSRLYGSRVLGHVTGTSRD